MAPDPSLRCAAGSISAAGAPFCYPLPGGFSDFSGQSNYGSGWSYKTLISVGARDLIEVLGGVYSTDTDKLSNAQLLRFFNRSGRLVVGQLNIVKAGKVVARRVAGHRGYEQTGTYKNGVFTDDTRVYAGRTVVAIYCQSKARRTQVQRACGQVARTVHIARL